MDNLKSKALRLKESIDLSIDKLDIQALNQKLSYLKKQTSKADFWQEKKESAEIVRQMSKLESKITPWLKIKSAIDETLSIIEMNDESLIKELNINLEQIELDFNQIKDQLLFNGQYDDYDVFLSLFAGAGGTDAQDWTQMLFRMYNRFFDKKKWKYQCLSQSPGDEAGLKSLTMQVEGDFVYGNLKAENGVHRLVRLSPFNSDHLRQTSFAKVEILPKIDQPGSIMLDDKDIKIDVFRSGGHGGQSVNTTDSAVRVTHLSSGITVSIQNERSQLQNKETALAILKSRLLQLKAEQHLDRIEQIKGQNLSAEWGNQIRSYVLHPYKQVKDLRTKYQSRDPESVLDGNIDGFIKAYLEYTMELKANLS